MLYTVVGRFHYCGSAWATSVNSAGIVAAAGDACDKIMHEDERSLPAGSYREGEIEKAMKENIEVIAIIVGNHVTRVKGEW